MHEPRKIDECAGRRLDALVADEKRQLAVEHIENLVCILVDMHGRCDAVRGALIESTYDAASFVAGGQYAPQCSLHLESTCLRQLNFEGPAAFMETHATAPASKAKFAELW